MALEARLSRREEGAGPSRPLSGAEDRAGGGHGLPRPLRRDPPSGGLGCLLLVMVFHGIASVVGTLFAWSLGTQGFDSDGKEPPELPYGLLGPAALSLALGLWTVVRAPLMGRLPCGASYFTVLCPSWAIVALLGFARELQLPGSVEVLLPIEHVWFFVLWLCSAPITLAIAFALGERGTARPLRSVLFGYGAWTTALVWLHMLPMQLFGCVAVLFGVGLVVLAPTTALAWLVLIVVRDRRREPGQRVFPLGPMLAGFVSASVVLALYLASAGGVE